MALLFQSHPDQWDLRKYLIPGKNAYWNASRYQSLMGPGMIVLLWEARGSEPPEVRGLYGWGITTSELQKDYEGRARIRVQYIERWVSKTDAEKKVPDENHIAPIPASEVLNLRSWSDHLIESLPVGTNFIVTDTQLRDLLYERVLEKFNDDTQLKKAVVLLTGWGKDRLYQSDFEPKRIVAKK